MSRVIKTIEIEGQPVKARFDTGAFHSYVLRKYLEAVPMRAVTKPYEVALGGETIKIRERALINGKIEGLDFDTSVVPVESLGKANGHDLDASAKAEPASDYRRALRRRLLLGRHPSAQRG